LGSAAAAERGQDGARLKGEAQSWNIMGEVAIIGRRAFWLLSESGQRWGMTFRLNESIDGVAGMHCC
jgi:hypothetical protein